MVGFANCIHNCIDKDGEIMDKTKSIFRLNNWVITGDEKNIKNYL